MKNYWVLFIVVLVFCSSVSVVYAEPNTQEIMRFTAFLDWNGNSQQDEGEASVNQFGVEVTTNCDGVETVSYAQHHSGSGILTDCANPVYGTSAKAQLLTQTTEFGTPILHIWTVDGEQVTLNLPIAPDENRLLLPLLLFK